MNDKQPRARNILKMIYLYLLSFVGIIVTVVASIGLLNLVLRHYVFQVDSPEYYADICRSPIPANGKEMTTPTEEKIKECEITERERTEKQLSNQIKYELSGEIAALIIGLPLWLYHWRLIRKEREL